MRRWLQARGGAFAEFAHGFEVWRLPNGQVINLPRVVQRTATSEELVDTRLANFTRFHVITLLSGRGKMQFAQGQLIAVRQGDKTRAD
ncbi:MAG: hypothetical protein FJX42_13470 [Alphaproteobacteria bacterium]|nr:hypothetical protein [Alphaproteobacteria bacterium]